MTALTSRICFSTLLLCAFALPTAHAQQSQATPLPAWEQLTPAQRDVLIAPIRARYNDNPAQRAEMMARAQRWQAMPADARMQAERGMRRWEGMPPEQRQMVRALFHRMRGMSPEARNALREQWISMSQEERQAWLRDNPPPRH